MEVRTQAFAVLGWILVVFSTLAPSTTAAQGGEDGCTRPCVADEDEGITGALPPGVFLDVDCEPPSNGTGYDPGCATCTACKMKVTVSFNGNGGDYCISVDNGAGWGLPLGTYGRPGWVVTNCNTVQSFFSVRVGLCAQMPGTGVYQWDHVLNCVCSW